MVCILTFGLLISYYTKVLFPTDGNWTCTCPFNMPQSVDSIMEAKFWYCRVRKFDLGFIIDAVILKFFEKFSFRIEKYHVGKYLRLSRRKRKWSKPYNFTYSRTWAPRFTHLLAVQILFPLWITKIFKRLPKPMCYISWKQTVHCIYQRLSEPFQFVGQPYYPSISC